MLVFLLLAVLLLTYSNGTNDNFKGVATLWGSGTLNYKTALLLATIATFTGSVCSYFFAETLIKTFSGQGLVPDTIIQSLDFALAVSLGAGMTVPLATQFGFPVSTTHGLIGALTGSGIIVGTGVNFSTLGKAFFLPLLFSPFIAAVLSSLVYWLFHSWRKAAGITKVSSVGVQQKAQPVTLIGQNADSFTALPGFEAPVDIPQDSAAHYKGRYLGINFQSMLNLLHYASAALVSFARGLNTPKLVSLLNNHKIVPNTRLYRHPGSCNGRWWSYSGEKSGSSYE